MPFEGAVDLHQFGAGLLGPRPDVATAQEEGCLDVRLLENSEDQIGVTAGTVVEGERHVASGGATAIERLAAGGEEVERRTLFQKRTALDHAAELSGQRA